MKELAHTGDGYTVYQDGYRAIFSMLGLQLSATGGYIVSKYQPMP